MSVRVDMIRGVRWFSGTYCLVGAVLIETDIGDHKMYIGGMPIHAWSSAAEDARHVAEYGTRVSDFALCAALFPAVTRWART